MIKACVLLILFTLLLIHKWFSSSSSNPKRRIFAPPRRVHVVVQGGSDAYELMVDLDTNIIIFNHVYTGNAWLSSFTFNELFRASKLPLPYPKFKKSMSTRGLNLS
ncbi:putative primary-amine oxidase [Rosa chinensis]|uniref:Putative primary-amine oxidase n=1 Tax=Rosa chinensis TaxID=74649 RepID=A0A2P6QDZ6_ROSCH|nr:putative primary-amine oxidase [Rosa chinensis]